MHVSLQAEEGFVHLPPSGCGCLLVAGYKACILKEEAYTMPARGTASCPPCSLWQVSALPDSARSLPQKNGLRSVKPF